MTIGSEIGLDDLETDPNPILARMRQEEPICFVESMDMWLVTRWDDVQYVEDHPELFTAATEPSFLARTLGVNMLTLDPPQHTRIKEAMLPPFQPGGYSGTYARDMLPVVCDELIDGFVDIGEVDLMEAYAAPVSTISLKTVLGLDNVTWGQLWAWCEGLITDLANFEDDPELKAVGERTKAELGAALQERMVHLRAMPDGTALSHMLLESGRGTISEEEIVNNVRLMISGGINEPRDGIGLATWVLLSDRDLLAEVEANPRLWPRLVEEVFRLSSPVGTITRMATEDVSLGGMTISRGALVAGVLRSANLDQGHWKQPERFDLHRREGQHAALALGVHRCLGEWLGRQEVRVGTQKLFERLPGLRLHPDERVELHGFEFRGPRSLRVVWDL
ncbi:MAG TPA: cytochrome P450 [Acidimicrobiia bacterium]